MKVVGVRELTDRINDILRMVEEEGESFEVTNHGKVIARLIPDRGFHVPSDEAAWIDIDHLATEIGTHIPDKVDAVDIISDMRREL
jgi:antitoxin (DNA-binding transcriptional repressor) of toxin-antitoxin stability system